MRKPLSLFLFSVAILLTSVQVGAVEVLDTISVNGIRYVISSLDVPSCKVVYKNGGYEGNVVIPESISIDGTDYVVVSLASGAFAYSYDLESVTLPTGLKTIGDGAFAYCNSLTFLEIPEGVTSVGEYAFAGSHRLNTLVLPSTLKVIGYEAFDNYSLARIFIKSAYIPSYSKRQITSIYNPVHYNGDYYVGNKRDVANTMYVPASYMPGYPQQSEWYSSSVIPVYYPVQSDLGWSVPDSILYSRKTKSIWGEYGNISLDGVDYKTTSDSTCMVMPASDYFYHGKISIPEEVIIDGKVYRVTAVSRTAFSYSKYLESIVLPQSVRGELNFSGCSSLRSLTVPLSVGELDMRNFSDCLALKEIIRDGEITDYNYDRDTHIYYFGNTTFQTKRYCMPEERRSADSYDVCHNNVYYTISDGSATVTGADNLSVITIPETINVDGCSYNVTRIDGKAFGTDLLRLFIPSTVTELNGNLTNCFSLEHVDLAPDSRLSAESLSEWLNFNSSLASDDNVVYVGHIALRIYDKSYSGNLEIKSGTKKIAGNFCSEASITGLCLPDGLEYIGRSAFDGCDNLESISIPESVGTMYLSSVGRCPKLKSLTIPEGCDVPDAADCDSNPNILIADEIYWKGHFVQTLDSRIYYNGYLDLDKTMLSEPLYRNADSFTCFFDAGISSIPDFFSSGRKLEKMDVLSLGSEISSVGNAAFHGASCLERIYISGCPEIGSYAFSGSELIRDIHIGSSVPPAIVDNANSTPERSVFQAEDCLSDTYLVENEGEIVSTKLASDGQAFLIKGSNGSYAWKSTYKLPYDIPGSYSFYAVTLPNVEFLDGDDSMPTKFSSTIGFIDADGIIQEYNEKDSRGRIKIMENSTQKADTIQLGKVVLQDNGKFGCRNEVTISIDCSLKFSELGNYSPTMLLDCIVMKIDAHNSTSEINDSRIDGVFTASTYANATLHVPAGSEDAYRNAPCWKLFQNIVADESTAVSGVQNSPSSGNYYDLQGRPTGIPTGKGLYIKDGRKILIRE